MTDDTTAELVTSNEGDDPFSQLVGEGKKFQSKEDLAKGKLESDAFISKLKDENNALRSLISNQEESKRSTQVMEDLLNRVSQSTLAREQTQETNTATQPRNQPDALTSRDVAEIFKVMRAQEQADQNQTKALSRVEEKYKDKAGEHLKAKASELGLDYDTLMATAKRSPTAFWNLIGENNNSASTGAGVIKGSVNSAALLDSGKAGVRNKAYYDKIKNDMGAKPFVLDRKIQVQMHKDMQELGDAWDS